LNTPLPLQKVKPKSLHACPITTWCNFFRGYTV
jgi:hypothetical protein